MKILVTGAKGFVGKNLCAQLNNIREGKARWYGSLQIDEVYEYDLDTEPALLDKYCRKCDFVFHLAGVNRPQNVEEFMSGNFGFSSTLLETLRRYGNTAPVMLFSSIQATLSGRFGTSEYGRSKKAGEELFFQYGRETGARVLVYRFPNLFGKWCRPNYNSAIATFCYNLAHDLPIQVNDRSVEMELLYIDDLVEEMIGVLASSNLPLKGETPEFPHRCEFSGVETVSQPSGRYCYVPVTHHTTLGEIVDIIKECAAAVSPAGNQAQWAPEAPVGSLRYKLMATFLSYLTREKAIRTLQMKCDERGSFTELVQSHSCGQVSINISRPGVTKGQHWHHSKWETFIVVKGHGLIQLRQEHTGEVWSYEVSGEKIQAVQMLPGFTHNIINLSQTEDLVTVMYCNEVFNPNRADTYFDPVVKE